MGSQKSRQISRNGKVRRKGQAEFLKARLTAHGLVVQTYARKKSLDQQITHLLAGHFNVDPSADKPRSCAGQIHSQSFRASGPSGLSVPAPIRGPSPATCRASTFGPSFP